MALIYNLSIQLLILGMRIGSLFNSKMKEGVLGRKNQDFSSIPKNGKVIWFHCASLGEFDMALPLMRKWKEINPDYFIVASFFSPSGMKYYNKRNHPVDFACFIPFDTRSNARGFLAHLNPEVAVFMKYEFWRNHLICAKKNGVKLFSASTIFRKNQRFFGVFKNFHRESLIQFDHFFLQNEESAQLLNSIEIKQHTVNGDLRFENVMQNKGLSKSNEIIENFVDGQKAFIIGSSWPIDEEFLLKQINLDEFTQKVIIAPHDISEGHITSIEKGLKKESVRYSKAAEKHDCQVLILDTIGHLSSAFQYGDVAYIGGGQTGALHNILEPAAYGLPVMYGPKNSKFPEAKLFVEKGFGIEVSTFEELAVGLKKFQSKLPSLSADILELMDSRRNISEGIVMRIESELKNSRN